MRSDKFSAIPVLAKTGALLGILDSMQYTDLEEIQAKIVSIIETGAYRSPQDDTILEFWGVLDALVNDVLEEINTQPAD